MKKIIVSIITCISFQHILPSEYQCLIPDRSTPQRMQITSCEGLKTLAKELKNEWHSFEENYDIQPQALAEYVADHFNASSETENDAIWGIFQYYHISFFQAKFIKIPFSAQ